MFYGGHVRDVADIQWLKTHGLDFGEIVLNDKESRNYWKSFKDDCASDGSFFLIAHGPHEGNPNSVENVTRKYIPALEETVHTLCDLGIDFLTTHLWMDSRYVLPEVIDVKIEALNKLRNFGLANGVTVSLENLSESALDFNRIISGIPELALTLDVGHGQLLTDRNRSFEIIRDFHKNVRHVHVHDNVGGTGVKDDLHLPLGEGVIDFEGIFCELMKMGYDGTVTLELKPEQLESSLVLAKSMVDMINQQLQLSSRR